MPSFIERITRKKIVDFGNSELNRALTLVDLTLLGIGSTVGVGFYVLAGNVARSIAGPAVVLCFMIAGIASLFAGLCYAEFGARVPKAGSAYIYSYVCVGELVAFIIGWNLILEYVIGASSVARGYSGYVDELANNVMSNALKEAMPLNVNFLSEYPDFLAFGLSFFVSALLAIGIKESSTMNNLFTGLNLIVVVYVIIAAATQADVSNWHLSLQDLNDTCEATNDNGDSNNWGSGGFSPYGFSGIMRGAATCFFGFVGFDCIATTGEEAINPSRNIPLSISISLLVIFLAYFGMASTLTLALAYCLQDPDAPLVVFFEKLGWEVSKWIVSIGAIFGFSASLIGVLLPLPRIVYAMANDGIIFRFLSQVNERFKTPFLATLITGFLAGVMAMFFDLESLVDMMSIGTLMAYTIVAIAVMLLRYVPDKEDDPSLLESARGTKEHRTTHSYSTNDIMGQLFNQKGVKEATQLSGFVATYATLVFCLLVAALALMLVLLQEKLFEGDIASIVSVSIVFALNIINVIVIARQPESKKTLSFKVPFVPWMPALSSLINVYLMFNLSPDTWIRFAVWMAIGFPIYFFYGICHSSEENRSNVTRFGLDNPAGPQDDKENLLFVIPTINVQLATPQNSAPNTPISAHGKKKPPPVSPLAQENDVKQSQSIPHKEQEPDTQQDNNNAREKEGEKAIALLDNVVDSHVSCTSVVNSGTSPESSKDNENDLKNEEVQSQELPPVLSVYVPHKTDEQLDDDKSHSSASDPGHENLEKVLDDKQKIIDGENTSSQKEEVVTDPLQQAVDESKVQGEEITVNIELNHGNSNNMNQDLAKEILQELSTSMLNEDNSSEPLYTSVNKKDNKKPDPINIPESDSESKELLTRNDSEPIMPSTQTSIVSVSSSSSVRSVPSTPVSRRHPTKILKRNSSFDEIPPSPLDSPLARRIDKFFIIPVQERKVSDSGTGPQSGDGHKSEDSTKHKMFYVDSDDSLESMINEDDPTGSTRDLKRKSSKDTFFLGEGLDTIRERGESKITIDDVPIDTNSSSLEKQTDMTSEREKTHIIVSTVNVDSDIIQSNQGHKDRKEDETDTQVNSNTAVKEAVPSTNEHTQYMQKENSEESKQKDTKQTTPTKRTSANGQVSKLMEVFAS